MTEPTSSTSGQPPPGVAAASDATEGPGERTGADQAEGSASLPGGSGEDTAREGPGTAELEDRWRRALADLDNLRKRYARELGRERSAERDLVTAAFLPVLDTIDRALEHAGADPRSIVEGVRTLREQALAVLTGLGYEREDEAGVPFDPARHEVVGVVGADGGAAAPGSVVAVVRPGYGAPGHQLRPAAVTVAQRPGD
ncbi:MAG: Protein grpE [Modestobacter sp.]|nr:Protein grpE [Modestobacter sp.]